MDTKIKAIVILFLTLCPSICLAQTALTAGDIAIIGYNMDDPDAVKFVPLVDLSAGTVIKFTDNAWTGTALKTNEGTYTYTASAVVPKGTVVHLATSGMSLSASGDQVFAYQGTQSAPSFIYGLSTKAWITSGLASANTSYLPATLAMGSTAMALTVERDNGYFNQVAVTGDKSACLSLIANLANWVTTDTRVTNFPAWSFSIGNYAAEPTANPTAFTASNILSWKHTAGWAPAAGTVAGYLVLRKAGVAPTSLPVDGQAYAVGDMVGDAKVAFVASGTTFEQKGTRAGTAYHYRVFAYNGSGTMTNYRQASPLAGTVTSSATDMGSYYAAVNPTVPTFVADLQARIRNPHVKVSYDLYDETMMAEFAFQDTAAAQRVATCAYSAQTYTYTPPFTWYSSSPFSREHTWCQSWMPSYPSTAGSEYADQHHIFPVNQVNSNAVRSNHPLGEVTTVVSAFGGALYGTDASNHTVYEPRDADKGDAARAMLYMSLRYDGIGGMDWTFAHLNAAVLPSLSEAPQDVQTLLTWASLDPVDSYEMARNDYIFSIQGNRNPLVDHPEWISYVDWTTLGYVAQKAAEAAPISDAPAALTLRVSPNPLVDQSQVHATAAVAGMGRLTVTDVAGRVLIDTQWELEVGENSHPLDMANLPKGLYFAFLTQGAVTAHARAMR
jgi:endonuclease I